MYDSGNKKVSSRLSQVHQLLNEAEHRSLSADINAPIPKITLVNTKVDMWFNVENEYWLSERVRSGREDYTNGL
ncbi:aminoacyl-tRNA hydrolase [Trifolium repens]|nr:aminoacyl-tRNA hydrolase [Trifolium repens]